MLSKSRGHVLRVLAFMHMLMNFDSESLVLSEEISESSVLAATNYVYISCQQTAFIAGRGLEVERYKSGEGHQKKVQTHALVDVYTGRSGENRAEVSLAEDATIGYCLTLPGKILYLTPLLAAKKFRSREGAVRAFYRIEEGLGKVSIVGGTSKLNQVLSEIQIACFPLKPCSYSTPLAI